MASIEDRWYTNGTRTERCGKGRRFRIIANIGGKKRTFGNYDKLRDAQDALGDAHAEEDLTTTKGQRGAHDMSLKWICHQFETTPIKVSRPSEAPSPSTVTQYVMRGRLVMDVLGGDMTLFELRRDAMQHLPKLVSAMQERGLGARSVNLHLTHVRTLYALGTHYGNNPVEIQAPKVSHYFLPEPTSDLRAFRQADIDRLLRHAPDESRALLMLACHTGMRIGELRGLRRSNLRIEDRIVRVREQGGTTSSEIIPLKTKDKGKRDVHFSDEVAQELRRHLDATAANRAKRPDLDLVFCTRNGTVESQANLTNRIWRDALRRACEADLWEAAGETGRKTIEKQADKAKAKAREAAKDEGKTAATIITRGNDAYWTALTDALIAKLDPEHPAVDRHQLFTNATFHHLRRSFATQLLIDTGNIVQVAGALGDTVEVALGYIIESPEHDEHLRKTADDLYRSKSIDDGAAEVVAIAGDVPPPDEFVQGFLSLLEQAPDIEATYAGLPAGVRKIEAVRAYVKDRLFAAKFGE